MHICQLSMMLDVPEIMFEGNYNGTKYCEFEALKASMRAAHLGIILQRNSTPGKKLDKTN